MQLRLLSEAGGDGAMRDAAVVAVAARQGDGTGATATLAAAQFGARQAEVVPQVLQQRLVGARVRDHLLLTLGRGRSIETSTRTYDAKLLLYFRYFCWPIVGVKSNNHSQTGKMLCYNTDRPWTDIHVYVADVYVFKMASNFCCSSQHLPLT